MSFLQKMTASTIVKAVMVIVTGHSQITTFQDFLDKLAQILAFKSRQSIQERQTGRSFLPATARDRCGRFVSRRKS